MSLTLAALLWPAGAGAQIDEIVVTATKKGETALQDTPMAVSAFSSKELERSLVADVRGLQELTPNLTISANTSYAQIYIRGVGTNNVFNGADPSATVHVDGVYFGRPFSQFASFLDVERVEVLRGPQGTLYGRNSIAGTINVISRQPGDELEAKVLVNVGDYNRTETSAYISGPLVPGRVQVSLSGSKLLHDGYRENIISSGNDVDDQNLVTGRGQLRIQVSETIEATTRVDQEVIDVNGPGYVPLDPYSPAIDSILGDFSQIALDSPNSFYVENRGISEDIRIQLGETVELRSITAYREAVNDILADSDQTDASITVTDLIEEQTQFSQELTLTGSTGDITYVVGAYYFKEEIETDLKVNAFVPGVRPQFGPSGETKSWAIFGEGTLNLTPEVAATLGLRYTDEEKSYSQVFGVELLASPGTFAVGPLLIDPPKISNAAWTPRVIVEWSPTEDAMLYASASRGFKSGGFNIVSSSAGNGFDPEELWSYELGARTDWHDERLRLNLTGFFYDYTDLQVQSYISPGVSVINNAATAEIKGLEFELLAAPNPNLDLSLNLSWLDATYGNYPVAFAGPVSFDASGNRLSNAPEVSGSFAAEYTIDRSDGSNFFIRGEASWQDTVYFGASNNDDMKPLTFDCG